MEKIKKHLNASSIILAIIILLLTGASFYAGYLWHDRNYRNQSSDLNHDGKVNILDFSIFVRNYPQESQQ